MSTDLDFTAPESESSLLPLLPGTVGVRNDVALCGPVAEAGEERELAGGVPAVRWTVRVPRGERGGSDLIDCVALEPALRERALMWPAGMTVEVHGAIRRRFFRAGGRTTTRVEVEVFRAVEMLPEAPADAPE
jgi:single-strand DNA-binding protein